MRWLLALPVILYQRLLSPLKPRCCRFSPTCSQYAIDALRTHGCLRGVWLAVRRILRCHPFHEPGFDPVPPRHVARERSPSPAGGTHGETHGEPQGRGSAGL